ncbi:MAG TPA: hypothetical protein VHJ39_13370 [Solirubrobacteraceae bacterium]|jgi:hypothetical protein|nr:hypothetical protein [Solirubrobacteraceae bacterium]
MLRRHRTSARSAAAVVLALRIVYGLGLAAAPVRLTKRWLGPSSSTGPTQVALRGLAAREILLHVGGLSAALTGAPVRPWLAASVAGDLSDIAATAGASGLPAGAAKATTAVAGGSALLSAAVAAAVDS